LGESARKKDLLVLIEAFKSDLLRALGVSLHVYGDDRIGPLPGGYLAELKRASGELEGDRIVFHRHIVDTIPVLQAADIVVLPSTWNEPFGRVLIEAMSCGVPVIGSKVGGIPEILESEFPEWLVPPGDSMALAKKISELMDWRETRPEFGARCRELVIDRFDKKRVIDDLLRTFSAVVGMIVESRESHKRLMDTRAERQGHESRIRARPRQLCASFSSHTGVTACCRERCRVF